jgi:hypothetical protein
MIPGERIVRALESFVWDAERLILAGIKLKRMTGINHKEVSKLSRKANGSEKCDYRCCVGSIVVCEAYIEDGRSTGIRCPRCKK